MDSFSYLLQGTPRSHHDLNCSQVRPIGFSYADQTIAAMRELYMKSGQGFLLVFSITSLSSLDELTHLRDQIVRIKNDPLTPLVIVGNKCDLEEDRAVSRARAFGISQSWGGAPYYETSARARRNVDEAFVDLTRQIVARDSATRQIREMERGDRSSRPNRNHNNITGHGNNHAPPRPARRKGRLHLGGICNIL